MFVIKKILTPFLLPPGLFSAYFLCSGAFRLYRRRQGGVLHLTVGLIFWLVSTHAAAALLLRGLESDCDPPARPYGDVIVLLGGGIVEAVPDVSGTGTPSESMLPRVVTAVRLQKRLNVPIIVSGGPVFSQTASEAAIVERFLVDLGVEKDRILLEERSRDTHENAVFVADICRQMSLTGPILVTAALHMKRAVRAFERAGLPVTAFPAGFHTAEGQPRQWRDFLPTAAGLHLFSRALHEYMGSLYYSAVY
jgi:uncharacterized SAM-binding protein YcdF (DUF218 family)